MILHLGMVARNHDPRSLLSHVTAFIVDSKLVVEMAEGESSMVLVVLCILNQLLFVV